MSRASRFIVTVPHTAELLVLGVLFHSYFIMVFHGRNSVDFFWVIRDLPDCKGEQTFGVFLLFLVCSYCIQSALDSKCRAILSYFSVTKINCLRKLLMKLH